MLQPRDVLKKISPYVPGKPIEEVSRELDLKGPIIKLASNENPLGTSPLAVRAIRRALRESNLYPDDTCFYLKKKLAEKHRLAPENILIANGSVELLPQVTLSYLNPEHSAVASQGAFIWFRIAVTMADGELIEVPMRGYAHDVEAMLGGIKGNTRLVYFANPNNPTGTIFDRKEAEWFFRSVPEDVLVIMDEAYFEYIDDPLYPDSLRFLKEGKNILILRTFSKVYGLAGLRLGYGMGPEPVIASLSKMRTSFNVNRLSQVAGLAALDDEEHVRRSKAVNDAGKTYLYGAYKKLGLSFVPSFGNFVFVDFDRDSRMVFEALLRKGIVTRTVREYGFPNALRISVGTAAQNRRLIRALSQVLEQS